MTGDDLTRVEVLHSDGRWYPGILHRWHRDPDRGWRAFVDYSRGPGLTHRTWVLAEQVRKREEPPSPAAPVGTDGDGGMPAGW